MKRNIAPILFGVTTGAVLVSIYFSLGGKPQVTTRHNDIDPTNLATAPADNTSNTSNQYNNGAQFAVEKTRELQDQVATLNTSISRLQSQMEQLLKSHESTADVAPDTLNKPDPPTEEQSEAQEKLEEYQKFQLVDANFTAQAVDNEWSDNALQRINSALYDESTSGLEFQNVDCRASICKLEIDQVDDNKLKIFKDNFREKIADVFGAGMAREDEAGNMVVFLAKDSSSFGLPAPTNDAPR